jgi:hypothetical protein
MPHPGPIDKAPLAYAEPLSFNGAIVGIGKDTDTSQTALARLTFAFRTPRGQEDS